MLRVDGDGSIAEVRVALQDARAVLLEELGALRAGVGDLDDGQLLDPSRCRGWNVADVLVHVHLGLQEMLLGLVGALAGGAEPVPDRDAASYWRSPTQADDSARNDHAADGLDAVRFVQRMAASYRRPRGVVGHLGPTIGGVISGVSVLPETVVSFQGHSLAAGDFLATWAVELAVHHLDLGAAAGDPDPGALELARDTAEALLDARLPRGWSTTEAVMIAAGRQVPDRAQLIDLGSSADRLPAFG